VKVCAEPLLFTTPGTRPYWLVLHAVAGAYAPNQKAITGLVCSNGAPRPDAPVGARAGESD
jgi:hypothetical protein